LKRKVPNDSKRRYQDIVSWFESGGQLELLADSDDKSWKKALDQVDGLKKAVAGTDGDEYLLMELLIHVLSEYLVVDKKLIHGNYLFQDQLYSALKGIGGN